MYEDKNALIEGAKKYISKLSQCSQGAVLNSKRAIHSFTGDLKEGAIREQEWFSKVFGTKDMREGTKAFLEKRKAQFEENV